MNRVFKYLEVDYAPAGETLFVAESDIFKTEVGLA